MILTDRQQRAADKLLDEEEARRTHLVVSLSGAHAYGFPSPDSDLDLKAIHIEDTAVLLSMEWVHTPAERLEVIDGVEVDYSSNEVRDVLLGIVRGNGNFIERVLSTLRLRGSPQLEELRPLVRASLSKRIHRHYAGFASGQLKEWEKTGGRSAKKLLYVLRTTLTGAHALSTGEIVTDLNAHLDSFRFGAARELIDHKRRGELAELQDDVIQRWREEVGRAFAALDESLAKSPLPDEPRNIADLDAWLLAKRRSSLQGA
jgi:predicted nucleotidyltransferase